MSIRHTAATSIPARDILSTIPEPYLTAGNHLRTRRRRVTKHFRGREGLSRIRRLICKRSSQLADQGGRVTGGNAVSTLSRTKLRCRSRACGRKPARDISTELGVAAGLHLPALSSCGGGADTGADAPVRRRGNPAGFFLYGRAPDGGASGGDRSPSMSAANEVALMDGWYQRRQTVHLFRLDSFGVCSIRPVSRMIERRTVPEPMSAGEGIDD